MVAQGYSMRDYDVSYRLIGGAGMAVQVVTALAAEEPSELQAKQQLLLALALPTRHALKRPHTPARTGPDASSGGRQGQTPSSGPSATDSSRLPMAVCGEGEGRCYFPEGLMRTLRLAMLNRSELLELHGRQVIV